MKKSDAITTLFLDIGGVLLSNGWDRPARRRAAARFKLDWDGMEQRHQACFGTHEEGKLTLREYLGEVIFYRKRSFSRAQFQHFMLAQSKPEPGMIGLMLGLKARHGLKVVALSNEGRDLNAYRIRKFKLGCLVDFFVSSCFVHLRKPDPEIFRLALDLAQVAPQRVLYIENTPMFCKIGQGLGMRTLTHTDYRSTCTKLARLGLKASEGQARGGG